MLVHITPGNGEVSISVQDDGPGIPAEKVPFLFERRHGSPHAEGLALSLVRQIVEAHGGRIDVTSNPGEGSTFTITLPEVSS